MILFTTLKRYSVSSLLNMLGLSVAYTAFIIILIQVTFEYGYDTYNKDSDRVYRAVCVEGSEKSACWAQPVINELGTVSPKIEAFSLYDDAYWNHNKLISVIRPNGAEEMFKITISMAYPDITRVLDIRMIEGDTSALSQPFLFIIPESMARKIWKDESAIGKTFSLGKNTFQVGAVYKDLPDNSVSGNYWYYSKPTNQKSGMGQVNYRLLLKLDQPESKKEISDLLNARLKEVYKDRVDPGEELPSLELQLVKDTYYLSGIRNDYTKKGNKTTTATMLAIALLILIIAGINYVNFASSLAPLRIKMLNLQKIMGGSRRKLIGELLAESVLISLLAFGIALLITFALQSTLLPEYLTAGLSLKNHLPLLGGCAVLALLLGLCAGAYPAFYMTSISPMLSLKGSFGHTPKGRLFRNILIGIQFAVAIVFVICALFMNLQNRHIQRFQTGYDSGRILITKLDGRIFAQRESFVNRLKQSSMIEAVAFGSSKLGGVESYEHWGASFGETPVEFNLMKVSYNFPDVMGINITQGRSFREEDKQKELSSVIFNQITPKLNGEPAQIGEGIKEDNNTYFLLEIIGFANLNTLPVRMPEEAFALLLGGKNQSGKNGEDLFLEYMYTKVKPGGDLFAARDSIIRIGKSMVPAYPFEPEFMDDSIAAMYTVERSTNYIVTVFSVIAIIISLVGVFGLVLFETRFRRKEIGIRRVHGAGIGNILGMLNKKYMIIVCFCFLLAAPVSYFLISHWLERFIYRIPLYWWIFALSFIIVLLLTAVTVTLRSLHAATENPADTISR